MLNKIRPSKEILDLVAGLRKDNKIKIVTTSGAFDILHPGHVKLLSQAKSYGNVLIVCLNSDKSIKKYKSINRPINNQDDRALMLSAIEFVDYVCVFNESDPRKILDQIKPDFHVKSKSGYKGIEGDIISENKGKLILLDDYIGYSTTNLIKKIKESTS